jgi:hypothetical protein
VRRESNSPPLFIAKNQKKPAQNNSVAGFTTHSLMPVVTTLGYQFIAINKRLMKNALPFLFVLPNARIKFTGL